MRSRRTYLFAGGGSGGHLFPGIAVAEELVRRDSGCRIVFAGSDRGIEQAVLAETPFSHVALPVSPPGALLKRPLRVAKGFVKSFVTAMRLLKELRPERVIGLGGYASVPLGLAAWRQGIPLILLEQNVVPGRATSLLSRMADRVCVSFEETVAGLPKSAAVMVTGNPLRFEVRACVNGGIPFQARRESTLLVLGGSQGAKGINGMVTAALKQLVDRQLSLSESSCREGEAPAEPQPLGPSTFAAAQRELRPPVVTHQIKIDGPLVDRRNSNARPSASGFAGILGGRVVDRHWRHASGTLQNKSDGPLSGALPGWRIVHQTGERDEVEVREAYRLAGIEAGVAAYFNDLPQRYADADLVVTRAGGTTLAELAAFGCPAVVVPYPRSIRDHQQRNAEHFARAGGVEIVAEGLGAEARMISALERLLKEPARRAAMAAAMRRNRNLNAASQVADLIFAVDLPVKQAA